MADNLLIQNKKARFQYEFIEKFVAGIELYGTEIKSIREGKASLIDAYCRFNTHILRPNRPELFLLMNISEYSHGGYANHEPRRERRLLLHRREISKLSKKIKTSGFTIVPIKMFLNKNGYAKVEIALARGKKVSDKREDIKDRDSKRELDRMKKFNG